MDLIEHFATQLVYTCDTSPEELQYEATLMIRRNSAAKDFVQGQISLDEYEGILYECGICPINFGNQVIENLDKDPQWTL